MPVSPVVRRAWTWGGGVAAAALLAWGGVNAVATVAHEAETVVTEVDQPGIRVVDVRGRGTVRVIGAAADAITVTADLTHGLRGPDHGLRAEGERLLVWGRCPDVLGGRCSAGFTLEVPAGVRVVAHADHGDVEVSGLRGQVDATTEHGDVEARNLSGVARLETDHGDVRADGLAVTGVRAASEHGDVRLHLARPARAVDVDTDHGDVEIVLPAGPGAYRVETHTGHGSARADVREDPFSPRSVSARTRHGDVVVRYP